MKKVDKLNRRDFLSGVNNIIENPYFVDVSTHNFNLLPNSAAINKDVPQAVYDQFKKLYGLDIKFNLSVMNHPQGTNWDSGTYEYVSGINHE